MSKAIPGGHSMRRRVSTLQARCPVCRMYERDCRCDDAPDYVPVAASPRVVIFHRADYDEVYTFEEGV